MTSAIEQYGKLSPFKPEALAGYRVGDLCDAPTLGRVEVVELLPQPMLLVRTNSGATCRIGWRALSRVEVRR